MSVHITYHSLSSDEGGESAASRGSWGTERQTYLLTLDQLSVHLQQHGFSLLRRLVLHHSETPHWTSLILSQLQHTHTVFRDQQILPKACDCGTSLQSNFLSALARHDYFMKPKNEQFHSFSLKFSTGCILNNGSKIYLQIWAPLGCAEP